MVDVGVREQSVRPGEVGLASVADEGLNLTVAEWRLTVIGKQQWSEARVTRVFVCESLREPLVVDNGAEVACHAAHEARITHNVGHMIFSHGRGTRQVAGRDGIVWYNPSRPATAHDLAWLRSRHQRWDLLAGLQQSIKVLIRSHALLQHTGGVLGIEEVRLQVG